MILLPTSEQITTLLGVCSSDPRGLRDAALLAVTAYAGARPREVPGLRVSNYDLAENTLLIHPEEGGRPRTAMVLAPGIPFLRAWVEWLRDRCPENEWPARALIPCLVRDSCPLPTPVNPHRIFNRVLRMCRRAGMPTIRGRALRRYYVNERAVEAGSRAMHDAGTSRRALLGMLREMRPDRGPVDVLSELSALMSQHGLDQRTIGEAAAGKVGECVHEIRRRYIPSVVNRMLAHLRRLVIANPAHNREVAEMLRTRREYRRPPSRGRAPDLPARATIDALLAGGKDRPGHLRDRALLAVMAGAGLKRYEIPGVRAGDYDPESGTLLVGGKRTATLSESRQRIVEQWLERIREHADERWRNQPLFPRLQGGYIRAKPCAIPICDATVNKILARICVEAGMPHAVQPATVCRAFTRDHPPARAAVRPFRCDPTPLTELLTAFDRVPDATWPKHRHWQFTRTRAILELMRSGVRMSEVLRLRVADLDQSHRSVQITTFCRLKSRREIALDERAWAAIQVWLATVRELTGWLFPGRHGGRMSRERGRQILREAQACVRGSKSA